MSGSGAPGAKQELLSALEGAEGALRGKRAVCLPDLFIDHIVEMPRWGEAQKQIAATFLRGGGNIRAGPHRMAAGGNAFNSARALARLGVATQFAGVTSARGASFVAGELSGEPLDLSLVRGDGSASMTVSMEFGPERTNVMFNDSGSVDGLTAGALGPATEAAVRAANILLVANWAQNRTAGTEFVSTVLSWARAGGAVTLLDPSDVWGKEQATLELLRSVGKGGHLDWFLLNESELREMARVHLLHDGNESPCSHDDFDGQGKALSKRLSASVAAHARGWSQTFRKGASEAREEVSVITPLRTTGAGDVWNAGFMAGILIGMKPALRLGLANAVASLYVARTSGPPPTLAQVREALAGGPPQ